LLEKEPFLKFCFFSLIGFGQRRHDNPHSKTKTRDPPFLPLRPLSFAFLRGKASPPMEGFFLLGPFFPLSPAMNGNLKRTFLFHHFYGRRTPPFLRALHFQMMEFLRNDAFCKHYPLQAVKSDWYRPCPYHTHRDVNQTMLPFSTVFVGIWTPFSYRVVHENGRIPRE